MFLLSICRQQTLLRKPQEADVKAELIGKLNVLADRTHTLRTVSVYVEKGLGKGLGKRLDSGNKCRGKKRFCASVKLFWGPG